MTSWRWGIMGVLGLLWAGTTLAAPEANWSRFRGPDGLGHAPAGDYPQDWDVAAGRQVRFRVPLPLSGASSPVLWGRQVFVTGADATRRELYCLSADTGELLWRQAVGAADTPKPRLHPQTGFASPTPVVDGERVYAIFPTGHLLCTDLQGHPLWRKRFDLSLNIYGHSTSLITHQGRLLVQLDQGQVADGQSRLLAIDGATGRIVWEVARPVAGSWTTPIVIRHEGREELITSARPWVIAYDPDSGREYWRVQCIAGDSAPSPVYAAGLVIVANIYARLVGLRPGGSGDVTATHIAYSSAGRLPDTTSPLATAERVYTLSSQGLLSCYGVREGELRWTHDYRTACAASPTLVGDRVLVITSAGVCHWVAEGDRYEALGPVELGSKYFSCPAFGFGRMYLRTATELLCLEKK